MIAKYLTIFFYMVFLCYSFNKYAYVFLWRLKNGQKVFCTHCATNDNQFRWKEKILLQCILNCYYMTIALVKVFVGHYSLNSHMGLYMLHCLCPMVKEKKNHWMGMRKRDVFLYILSVCIDGSIICTQARVSVTNNIFIGATFICLFLWMHLYSCVQRCTHTKRLLTYGSISFSQTLTHKQHDHIFIFIFLMVWLTFV